MVADSSSTLADSSSSVTGSPAWSQTPGLVTDSPASSLARRLIARSPE